MTLKILTLSGATTWVRRKPDRVELDYVDIPRALLSAHKLVTLVADIFFVNSVLSLRRLQVTLT
jgi:hypothetical protein